MKIFATILIGLLSSNLLFAAEQFMLRYEDEKSHWMMSTGCYSATGYAWQGPTIETLKAHRETLLEYARQHASVPEGNGLWAWSMNQVAGGNRLALDLENGSVMAISEGLAIPKIRFNEKGEAVVEEAAHRKALVFCQCRVPGLRHCARHARLGPLKQIPSFVSP